MPPSAGLTAALRRRTAGGHTLLSMTLRYTVAADHEGAQRHNSTRGNQMPPERVPAGQSHAVANGAIVTMCERSVMSLVSFPELDWKMGSRLSRCNACQRQVALT
jgi:hypothetical protein